MLLQVTSALAGQRILLKEVESRPRLAGFDSEIKVFSSTRHQVLSYHVVTCSLSLGQAA